MYWTHTKKVSTNITSILFIIWFSPNSNKFSRQLTVGRIFQNNTFILCIEKSILTDPGNYIIPCDWLNFHSSYNTKKLSIYNWGELEKSSPVAFSLLQQCPAGKTLSCSFLICPVVREHTSLLLLEIFFSPD